MWKNGIRYPSIFSSGQDGSKNRVAIVAPVRDLASAVAFARLRPAVPLLIPCAVEPLRSQLAMVWGAVSLPVACAVRVAFRRSTGRTADTLEVIAVGPPL